MIRRTIFAIATVAAIGAATLIPTAATAGGGKGGGMGGGMGGGGFFGGGFGQRRFASPGEYRVVMEIEGGTLPSSLTTTLRLERDPNVPSTSRIADEEEVPLPKID